MRHEIRLCVRFPWVEIRSCTRCGLLIVNSDRTGISFLRPPPSSKREITNDRNETREIVTVERGSYSWFELEPPPGSLRYLTPFVASAPLRESPACIEEAA